MNDLNKEQENAFLCRVVDRIVESLPTFIKPLYTNKDMLDILQISSKTLQKYRAEGLLGFSQSGDKFYYTLDDLKQFLARTHIEAF